MTALGGAGASGDITALTCLWRDDDSPVWQQFRDPQRILQASDLTDVPRVLRAAEQYAKAGKWCVGYVAYEAAPAFDRSRVAHGAGELPLAHFAVYDVAEPAVAPSGAPVQTGAWTIPPRSDYYESLARIHGEIVDGNTFQVNHTVELQAHTSSSARDVFAELYGRQPTSYAAFLDVGGTSVLSVSPELFFSRRGSQLTMRPMKGTIARGSTSDSDDANRRWLLTSAKNRAENTMIVDLLRNDLGRIASPGTVRVTELVRLETYPSFHALTSTITAEAPGVDLVDIFAALFPCGSVTGAPKASTMRIIAEEESRPRGVYCGAIGILAPGGDTRFSVAIRTAELHPGGTLRYSVGGGITAASDPAEEYDELLTKARIALTLPGPDLLETMLLHDGEFAHVDRHLGRLTASSIQLGYIYDEVMVRRALDECAAQHPSGSWRARLLLSRAGGVRVEAHSFMPEPQKVMTARICADRVRSDDVRLRHKLTDRGIYDSRRIAGVDTTLLVNERDEVTEFLFGNIVVRRGADLLTPPLGCGLLPGVGRAIALADGVREQVISVAELQTCDEVWHVNSLRGWNRVQIDT
ncbi:chorismate-binding protein [Cumulibacter soli]|uniref:chorismate-binding protein n=1 Tax=Cumulibacter soli TaxID=2546344 RepID=UPI001067ED8C|nr:chorismate-binding protein [Cumulibacter soli]